MKTLELQCQTCITSRVLLFLSFLLLLTYSNTFNASWHFDDFHNITRNERIHIDNLRLGTFYELAVGGSQSNRAFYRPVSNLSFAVNWYFGQNDVKGYHFVNICIHILTAFFLYLAILSLFKTPNLLNRYTGNEHFIAFAAVVLWALNPIQTQAVTYIVQRMASMAALFYVLGIYLYIQARISRSWRNRVLLYSGVLAAFMIAVGSKENALMFPASILLVEMIFFRHLSEPDTKRKFILGGCAVFVAIFATGIFLFMGDGLITRIQSGYEKRAFTLFERLFTQPRIIVFYITQIFYPIADRLSLVHDFEISTSLFRPWTTLPAIMIIFSLIGSAFWQITRLPLLSFAILFFFLNHIIESSIISLELVFEHRNYLPSLFLFVPVAAGIKWIIDYYSRKKPPMAVIVIGFVTVLFIVLGTGTYVRNMAWIDERTLWQDALEKAPKSARPYHNLASGYYAKIGDWDKVEILCEEAMNLYDNTKNKAAVISLNNIANAYIKRDADYAKVAEIYNKVLDIEPNMLNSRYHLSLALIRMEKLDLAIENIHFLLSEKPNDVDYLNLKAFLLLKKQEPEKALPYLSAAMQENPDHDKTLLNFGMTKLMTGNYRSAEHYLGRIPNGSSQKITALLLLIENSVRGGNDRVATKYAEELIAMRSPQKIRKKLMEKMESGLSWPVSIELVAPVIAAQLQEQSGMILETINTDGR